MRIRFGLTTLALVVAMLAGNNVRGQEYTPPADVNYFYAGTTDMSDCCAGKQQGSDSCSKPCAKTKCDQAKCSSGKKCCDKGCCAKDCCQKSGCCTGTTCSEGQCCPGCTGKTSCPMCKAGKCCKGKTCCQAQQKSLLFPGIGLDAQVQCKCPTGCQVKSCRAIGCCAAAMARMVVPLPPLPGMMVLPVPPQVVLSVVRMSLPGQSPCPFCQMMGVPCTRPCVTAPVTVRTVVPGKVCVITRPGSPEREYAVEVRRMEKVGCEVCEKMTCPKVTLEENQPVRVQIAGQLILGDAGLNRKVKETAGERPSQSMLDLLVQSCGGGKVCVGLETDQLQPPVSGGEHGVGFRRCMRLIRMVELNKPTRVVLERGPKGGVRSWLEVTVRPVQEETQGHVKTSPAPACTAEASEPSCGPENALGKLKEWCKIFPGACGGTPTATTAPFPVPMPPPPLPCPYGPAMLNVWQGPQPIMPPVPPVPTSTLLPPPLPVASSAEPMPPPAPIPPPVPSATPYGYAVPPAVVEGPLPPPCVQPANELRGVELSVVEEKGKQVLRLETGDMRLTCEKITLEPKGQGRITLCAGDHQVCVHGKALEARADRVKVEDASTFSLMGKVQVHTDLGSPAAKGGVTDVRGQGSAIQVNMLDGGISIRQVGR